MHNPLRILLQPSYRKLVLILLAAVSVVCMFGTPDWATHLPTNRAKVSVDQGHGQAVTRSNRTSLTREHTPTTAPEEVWRPPAPTGLLPCHWTPRTFHTPTRTAAVITCDGRATTMTPTTATRSSPRDHQRVKTTSPLSSQKVHVHATKPASSPSSSLSSSSSSLSSSSSSLSSSSLSSSSSSQTAHTPLSDETSSGRKNVRPTTTTTTTTSTTQITEPDNANTPAASSCNITFTTVRAGVQPSVTSVPDASWLKRVIRAQCGQPGLRIPRVVHYVQYGPSNMSLEHFISVLSVAKSVRPCLIVLHGDAVPAGPYWRAAVSLVSNIVHVPHERPTSIFGHRIAWLAHSADIARIHILQEYGGVYLDQDQFIVSGLYDLYNHSMVISKEMDDNCGNGMLVAEPGAPFLGLWLDEYRDFNDDQWAVHSTIRPYQLALRRPDLVTVTESFFKPNYLQVRDFFDRTKTPTYDWSHQHGFHLYHYHVRHLVKEPRIDRQDNVIGELVREILYGHKDSCFKRGG